MHRRCRWCRTIQPWAALLFGCRSDLPVLYALVPTGRWAKQLTLLLYLLHAVRRLVSPVARKTEKIPEKKVAAAIVSSKRNDTDKYAMRVPL